MRVTINDRVPCAFALPTQDDIDKCNAHEGSRLLLQNMTRTYWGYCETSEEHGNWNHIIMTWDESCTPDELKDRIIKILEQHYQED